MPDPTLSAEWKAGYAVGYGDGSSSEHERDRDVFLAMGHTNDGALHDPEYDVIGVFSTREDAEAYAKTVCPKTGWVERCVVDKPDDDPWR